MKKNIYSFEQAVDNIADKIELNYVNYFIDTTMGGLAVELESKLRNDLDFRNSTVVPWTKAKVRFCNSRFVRSNLELESLDFYVRIPRMRDRHMQECAIAYALAKTLVAFSKVSGTMEERELADFLFYRWYEKVKTYSKLYKTDRSVAGMFKTSMYGNYAGFSMLLSQLEAKSLYIRKAASDFCGTDIVVYGPAGYGYDELMKAILYFKLDAPCPEKLHEIAATIDGLDGEMYVTRFIDLL